MPPQGESTGIAIEDGVLIARILSQHTTKTEATRTEVTRSIEQLFADYESVRRPEIDKHYKAAEKMSKMVSSKPAGMRGLLMDLVTIIILSIKKRQRTDVFKGDVRSIELPV
jgi:2-polyprenyl-6-methoxyphenol hydroxylase-like FAD-dependent oxidoreductase